MEALPYTLASERPSLYAMRPVGVFPFANFWSLSRSVSVQDLPELGGVFAIRSPVLNLDI